MAIKKKTINKHILYDLSGLRDLVMEEEKNGFDIDWESSKLTPCPHCGVYIIYFKRI